MSNAALSCELIRLAGVVGKGAGGGPSGNLKPCNFGKFGQFLKLKFKSTKLPVNVSTPSVSQLTNQTPEEMGKAQCHPQMDASIH